MKHFNVIASELREATAYLKTVVTSSLSLPVLTHVHFSVGGTISVSGTDLDQHLTYKFNTILGGSFDIFKYQPVGDPFNFLLSYQALKQICSITDQATLVHFELGEQICVKAGANTINFPNSIDAKEWPTTPSQMDVAKMVKADEIISAYKKVAPYASQDITRAILQNVACFSKKKEGVLVATTGVRLLKYDLENPVALECLIPITKFLQQATPLDSFFGVEENLLHFMQGPCVYTTRICEDVYPNWQQVMPQEPLEHSFTLTPSEVRQLKHFACNFVDGGSICFTNTDETVQQEDGKVIFCLGKRYTGEGSFAVNGAYFMKAVSLGCRSFAFTNPRTPLLSHHKGYTILIMPIRIS